MKRLLVSFLLLFSVLLNLIEETEARLLIIPPQQMVDKSDCVIVGTVIERDYNEQHRKVKIEIELVLKGQINQKELLLEQDKPPMYGWLGFDFPDEGTKILFFLEESDTGYFLTGDTNSVATVKDNGEVKLYNGWTMGKWTPKQYEDAYEVYLKDNYKQKH